MLSKGSCKNKITYQLLRLVPAKHICMKPLLPIALFFCALAIALNSCKKETVTPYKNAVAKYSISDTSKVLPISMINTNAYPVNYLRVGNYWIYNCETVYTNGITPAYLASNYSDSTVVVGYKLNNHSDTLFQVNHYRSDEAFVASEYLMMTDDGLLKNEQGELLYYFSTLPEVSDMNQHRKGCGQWTWEPYHWIDTAINYEVGKYSFQAGLYVCDGATENCVSDGRKSYTLVRGIGIAQYEESLCSPVYECNIRRRNLIRFKLAH